MNGDFIIKLKKFGILSMIVLFVIGLIYSIIVYISNALKKPEPITMEQISEYIKEENLVTDYNTFFTLEGILGNLLDEFVIVEDAKLSDKKIDSDIYEILDEEYKKLYDKDEVVNMIVDFTTKNYTPKTDDDFLYSSDMLTKAYKMNEYYILEFNNMDNLPVYLVVKLLAGQGKYSFILLEEQGGN